MDELREEFLKREVTVKGASGKTHFTLTKMPATKAWDVLEDIRDSASGALDVQHSGGTEAMVRALVGALPKPFARRLRDTMFGCVTFRNQMMQSPAVLAGNEETAFDAIEADPIAIYEMFLRSLSVNFTDSFVALFEKISTIQKSTGPLPNTETSQVS